MNWLLCLNLFFFSLRQTILYWKTFVIGFGTKSNFALYSAQNFCSKFTKKCPKLIFPKINCLKLNCPKFFCPKFFSFNVWRWTSSWREVSCWHQMGSKLLFQNRAVIPKVIIVFGSQWVCVLCGIFCFVINCFAGWNEVAEEPHCFVIVEHNDVGI
mgnify:CR=1 FL=1